MKAGNAKLSVTEVSQSCHVSLVNPVREISGLCFCSLIKFCMYPLLLHSPQNLRACGEGAVITTSIGSSVFNNVLLIIPFLRFTGLDAQVQSSGFMGSSVSGYSCFFPVSCL